MRWCAFRNKYEHIEIGNVIVAVVAIWAGTDDTRSVRTVTGSIGAVARMIAMLLAKAQASIMLVRGGRGDVGP